mmetsp:Transcript_12732/g.18073  ORF Transcript_12732/g.18073 Transcript_12732/m.18073 type:complete len:162 (+) Transcript_12732:192-677(+)
MSGPNMSVESLQRQLAALEQSKQATIAELQLKLTTLERTAGMQREAMAALHKDLVGLRAEAAQATKAKNKAEARVEKLNNKLKEKDVKMKVISEELEDKKAHVFELAMELRNVEEQLIVKSSGSRMNSVDTDSMPSLSNDSIGLKKKKMQQKKQLGNIDEQ